MRSDTLKAGFERAPHRSLLAKEWPARHTAFATGASRDAALRLPNET